MNTVIQIVFFILSALVLVSGLMVVVAKNIVHAALWLIASFAGVAALYFLMEAPFIGVVQILVYAGAVAILMLFAIMLTRQVVGEATRQLFERWWVAAITAASIFLLVLIPTILSPGVPAAAGRPAGWPRTDQAAAGAPRAAGTTAQTPAIAGTLEIGRSFMQEYLLPFEVASILLLVALIGAVVIAYEERSRRRRVPTLAEEVALRRAPQGADGSAPLAASGPDIPGQAGNTARTY
jgi:NADH-quinone oxidoreductase subunit J